MNDTVLLYTFIGNVVIVCRVHMQMVEFHSLFRSTAKHFIAYSIRNEVAWIYNPIQPIYYLGPFSVVAITSVILVVLVPPPLSKGGQLQ